MFTFWRNDMTIKAKEKLYTRKIAIDLTGPQGNAFVLLAYAKQFARQLGKDASSIITKMKSGDYENLVEVFDDEFGDYVDIYK
jgi:hypothetical protein